MTIDDRARAAGARLRSEASLGADLDTSFQALLDTVHRRQRTRLIAVAAAVSLIVGGLTFGLTSMWRATEAGPADHSKPAVSSSAISCGLAYFTCTGQRITVNMAVPFSWSPSSHFDPYLHYVPDRTDTRLLLVQSDRSDSGVRGGVTVLEDVEPLKYTRLTVEDTTAGKGANALAAWLSRRPYLDTSPPRQTSVDGLHAWTVQARLKRARQQGPSTCNYGFVCAALFAARDGEGAFLGIWNDLVGNYTFVDVPGAGTTVIWSWTFGDSAALAGNQPLVNSIRFTAG